MSMAPMTEEGKRLAPMIDHTVLKADAPYESVDLLCREAATYEFASVCVNPGMVRRCSAALQGSPVAVCTVIGFPLGATTAAAKAAEAEEAVRNGARELDMVIPIAPLKAGCDAEVLEHVCAVVKAGGGALVKVIIETCFLEDDEKVAACRAAVAGGARFVKTSTGFGSGGATVEDIRLMRETVGPNIGVKASGGVRSLEDALAMVEAGATRLGTSSGVRIVTGV